MTKDLLTWWFGISQLTQIHIKNIRTTGTCMRQNLFSAIDNLMICRIEPKEWKENKKFNQIWIDLFRIGLLNALFQDNINILNSCHVLRVFLFKLYNLLVFLHLTIQFKVGIPVISLKSSAIFCA